MFTSDSLLGQSLWNFLIVFTFTWISIYTVEPEWTKTNGEFSKKKAAWYAFAISILVVLVLWLVFWVINWADTRSQIDEVMRELTGNKTPTKQKAKKLEREYKMARGNSPLEKLQNMLN